MEATRGNGYAPVMGMPAMMMMMMKKYISLKISNNTNSDHKPEN